MAQVKSRIPLAGGQADPSPPGRAALLLVDFINDMRFDGGAETRASAVTAAWVVAGLRDAADAIGLPVIYVNDNYGQWRSERSQIVDYCRGRSEAGRELADILAPRDRDHFVIKPQFSGFYATNLPVLLPKLGVSRLVLTGVAADICVLFTAADAHMRDYDLWVPADAVASCRVEHAQWALRIMSKSMGAEIRPTSQMNLVDWLGQ